MRNRTVRALATLVLLFVTAQAGNYTVRLGDTLSAIAARVGATVRALAQTNDLADPDRILVGQVLTIPGASAGPGGAPGGASYHVVRSGETLSGIAGRHGISVADLAAANGITDPDRVLAGARLRIGQAPALPAAPAAAATHTIRRGEALSTIASRYSVSVAELAAANGIADPDRIVAGARLTIPGGWRCPVDGPVSFSNDFGVPKPGGRFHEGIDLYAERGTPVVAPVAGTAEQIEGSVGGLQVWLRGDDGTLYIGSHLAAFGAGGRVGAGDIIGTVGTSGNAAGTRPHLHFETHPAGSDAANPFPLLRRACG